MNKSTLTALGALLIAGSAMAATPASQPAETKAHGPIKPVITEVQGKRVETKTVGTGYRVQNWSAIIFTEDSWANHIVYGDNNEVYIYNILPNAPTSSYAKGTLEGDKIVLPLPQTLRYDPQYNLGFNLTISEYLGPSEDHPNGWFSLTDKDSVTLTVEEDGTLTLNLEEGELLGLTYVDDDEWSAYGVTEMSISPFNPVPVTPPDTYEVKQWAMFRSSIYGYPVKFAFSPDGTEAYIGGFIEGTDYWLKANVENGTRFHIPANQYIGIQWNLFSYVKFGKLLGYDETDGYELLEDMPDDYEYILTYDEKTGRLVPDDDKDVCLVINNGDTKLYELHVFHDYWFADQDNFAGTPANPEPYDYINGSAQMYPMPFDFFLVTIPTVSTEGKLLDHRNLYYVIYLDGDEEEFIFDPEEYEMYETPEAFSEVPFGFADGWIDIYSDNIRQITFFIEGITTIGVQSVYYCDGVETRSDRVECELAGVKDLTANKEVASVAYFDLAGRSIANPGNGLYIERTTFTDGTTVVVKKAIR